MKVEPSRLVWWLRPVANIPWAHVRWYRAVLDYYAPAGMILSLISEVIREAGQDES